MPKASSVGSDQPRCSGGAPEGAEIEAHETGPTGQELQVWNSVRAAGEVGALSTWKVMSMVSTPNTCTEAPARQGPRHWQQG